MKKTTRKLNSQNTGILLVEALLAIVILSVAITATIRSFAYATRVHRITSENLRATRLASEKMAELEALPKLQEGESKGNFKRPDEQFFWKLLIEPVARSSEDEKVATVKYLKTYLKVSWGLNQAHKVSVSTILIKKKDENDEKEDTHTSSTGINTR